MIRQSVREGEPMANEERWMVRRHEEGDIGLRITTEKMA
jgi:hypothetical protein